MALPAANIVPEISNETSRGYYKIEYKGRDVSDDRELTCQYGKAKRIFRMAEVSNGDFEEVCFVQGGMARRHSFRDRQNSNALA